LESPTDPPSPPTPESHKDANNEAGHPQGKQLPTVTSKVHVPPPHSHYEVTCNKKRDGWDWAKMGAEFVGIIFLIAYTLYTCGIYHANRKAAEAARDAANTATQQRKDTVESFHVDQRAWIFVKGTKDSIFKTHAFTKIVVSCRN